MCIYGFSVVLVMIGVFILFVGWFGFNGGLMFVMIWDVLGVFVNIVLVVVVGMVVGYCFGFYKDGLVFFFNFIFG